MELLFSEIGYKRLEDVSWRRLLCAFDFDGTLAPIAPLPEQAHLPETIRERLIALSEYAPVAIITGRSVDDIRPRLGFAPDFVVGNHGLEGVPGWETLSAQHRYLSSGWMAQLSETLKSEQSDPGIFLEYKQYSLSVHYRLSHHPEQAMRVLERIFAKLSPRPRVVGGKYVFNLLAEDACNKGSALARLMEISGAPDALYVGDDVTDEDVFRMRHPGILSIRIERHVGSAADFYLPRTDDVIQLLEELTARLRAEGARNWMRVGLGRRA